MFSLCFHSQQYKQTSFLARAMEIEFNLRLAWLSVLPILKIKFQSSGNGKKLGKIFGNPRLLVVKKKKGQG